MTQVALFFAPWVAIFILPPTRWGIRIWAALAITIATFLFFQPAEPFNSGPFGGFGGLVAGILIAFLVGCLAAVGLRWFLTNQVIGKLRSPVAVHRYEAKALGLFDSALAALAGICAGLIVVLFLALILRGAAGGIAIHLIISALAISAVVFAALRLRGLARPAGVAGLSIVAAMAMLGALYWPQLVERRAEAVSRGLPFCIRAADRPATFGETMLLTLPLGKPGSPGLILTVMHSGQPFHYRWSYRGVGFMRYGSYAFGGCPE